MRRHEAGRQPVKAQRRKVVRKRRVPQKSPRPRSEAATGQDTEIARLTRELNDSLERQKAMAEVQRIAGAADRDIRGTSGHQQFSWRS
jgi:hypothetical protein